AGGVVGEEAHRVEVLAGAAGGDEQLAADQVAAHGAAPVAGGGDRGAGGVEDRLGLRQPAGAGVGSGEPPVGGLEHGQAALAQHGDVFDGRGVLPHLGVHRRCHHDRGAGDQGGGGQQIVGAPHPQPRQQIGGGRGDHHQIGLLAQAHMGDLLDVLEDGGEDRVVAERLPGGGADELEGGAGGDDADVRTVTD